MPLDGNPAAFTVPDLKTPSFEALAYVLEHRELWPDGWKWDFVRFTQKRRCGTAGCAAGIAMALWGKAAYEPLQFRPRRFSGRWCCETSTREARKIFISGSDPCMPEHVTPAMVAKRIRQHLAGQPITFTGETEDAA